MKQISWEQEFDKAFVSEEERGAFWLFRVNPDGSRSIALPSDVKAWIRQHKADWESVAYERGYEGCRKFFELEKHILIATLLHDEKKTIR